MRCVVVISVLAALCFPCTTLANPDGPVGSIVVEPAYHQGRSAFQWQYDAQAGDFVFTGEHTWEARLGVLLPLWNQLTLGLEVSHIKGPAVLSNVRLAQAPTDLSIGLNHIEEFTEWTISGRFYFPLTAEARRELSARQP